jgi:hypothetical protein
MVVVPVSLIPSSATDISVDASSSIVLPSKKVISALESFPVLMASPGCNVILTVAGCQVSVPALLTKTSPPTIESIVSGELCVRVGVGDGVGVGLGVGDGVGVGLGVGDSVGVGESVGVDVGVSVGNSATVPMGGVVVSVGFAPHP